MASIVSGAISTLSTVLTQKYRLYGGLQQELQSIKDEFEQMMDFLAGADLLVQDYPDLRSWVAQVRDVAYDVEDVLAEFVMRCTYLERYGVFEKIYAGSVEFNKARNDLATRVQEIKTRIKGISESHVRCRTRYESLMPEQGMPSSFQRVNNMQHDRRDDALLLDEADLVGIEVPKKELTDLILNEDRRRNVFSVVGMGGLGKTTLVKKVYDDVIVKSHFTHHAWIVVSESFKLEELFKDTIKLLFKEDGRKLHQELDGMKINSLKSVVKEFLLTKKYIVVFDDVWKQAHWDAIHLAFPRNQFGSRIVITSRKREVGQAASTSEVGGSIYELKVLPTTDAERLFYRKAFRGCTSCPPHLKQICEKILGACGGLPLAIEVIGSCLAGKSQSTEDWESFYKRLGVEMARTGTLDEMTKLLSLSYHDLPLHLKNCFLYLSIFPDDSEIYSQDLARLWIGEGFVERTYGMTLEEVAQSYLNELAERCLVQVAETNSGGIIEKIRVHDIIRRIILLKASEHNITTIFRGEEEGMSSQNNVRRLSVHASISEASKLGQDQCKSIRTLFVFNKIGGNISDALLSQLLSNGRKLLKVLYLTGAQLEEIPNEIFKLFHLKYLGLQNTNVSYVPKSIGMLQSLQYLILWGSHVTVLPVEIEKLQHLRHLIMGQFKSSFVIPRIEDVQGVRASFRIGTLKSLQLLYYIEADQVGNIKVVTEIGKLIHLRILRIIKLKKEDGKELCSSLGNLRGLRELHVYAVNEEEFIDLQYFKPTDLPRLHRLLLAGRLEKCPELISSLNRLTDIHLRHTMLGDDPLKCLQDLPNLIILDLVAAYEGESLCFKAGGFPKLKKLRLILSEKLRWVTVEENAMPSLKDFTMRVFPSMEDIPKGIQYLVNLQDLEFTNMSNEFVNKLENVDMQSATYKSLLHIPSVYIGTWADGRWLKLQTFKNLYTKWERSKGSAPSTTPTPTSTGPSGSSSLLTSSSTPSEIMASGGSSSTPVVDLTSSSNPRLTDIGWKYGTKVPNTRDDVQCNFCHKIHEGGITRHKQHLLGSHRNAKMCTKVPRHVQEELGEYMRKKVDEANAAEQARKFDDIYGVDEEEDDMEDGPPPVPGRKGPLDMYYNVQSSNKLKIKGVKDDVSVEKCQKEKRDRAVQLFARWMYDAGIAFNAVNYESLQEAVDAIADCGVGMKAPTYHEVRVQGEMDTL